MRDESALYLGVDCGTQGTKALLVDDAGRVHGRGYALHRIVEKASGAREQNPSWWVEAATTAMGQALSRAGKVLASDVRAIGVSGQQHGLVILDEDFEVIRPAKLWNDTETAFENEELVRSFGGAAVYGRRFGIVPLPGYTVSKLAWIERHEPENFARIRHILLPHEYLNFWLTGKFAAEYGDASGTGYFDPRTRVWTPEVLAAIDHGNGHLIAALPSLRGAKEMIGTVRAEVATLLGLPANCEVSVGGGDNMMGAIGTGNVHTGIVTLSLGTSSTVYSFRTQPPEEVNGSVAPFCSSTDGWLPLVCTMNATNVVTATVDLLGITLDDIDLALSKTSPGAGGLIFLPFLNGERTPNLPHARGSLHGISANNYMPANLIRATIEGVSFGVLNGLGHVLTTASVESIRVIGGGGKSRAWRQLIADITGVRVETTVEEEAGCLGAAIQAIVASSTQKGEAVSFSETARDLVKLDQSATCEPNAALKTAYLEAFQAYNSQMALTHPQSSTEAIG